MRGPQLLLIVGAVPALVLALLDGYQAVTGRRLSKKPSVRTDRRMRQESAVAALVLLVLVALMLALAAAL